MNFMRAFIIENIGNMMAIEKPFSGFLRGHSSALEFTL